MFNKSTKQPFDWCLFKFKYIRFQSKTSPVISFEIGMHTCTDLGFTQAVSPINSARIIRYVFDSARRTSHRAKTRCFLPSTITNGNAPTVQTTMRHLRFFSMGYRDASYFVIATRRTPTSLV